MSSITPNIFTECIEEMERLLGIKGFNSFRLGAVTFWGQVKFKEQQYTQYLHSFFVSRKQKNKQSS